MTYLPPELHETEDGSLTLYTPTFGEHYHSTHGAVQESRHIYTGLALRGRLEGWDWSSGRVLEVLEVGFGTGLNALLTTLLAEELQQPIRYTTLEKYPIGEDVYSRLHYDLSTEARGDSLLQLLHNSPWGEDVPLSPTFTLHKVHTDLTTYLPSEGIDVIYYDAFSPEAQPELWDEVLFHRLYTAARAGAKLTTYCAKGEVRRRLQRAGFAVERLAGPPGKREVLRATK